MTVTVTEARADLPKLLDAVEGGHEVTITRHGKPVAVLMSKDAQRRHRTARAFQGAARVHKMAEDARGKPLFGGPGVSQEYAEEWVDEIRARRDAEG